MREMLRCRREAEEREIMKREKVGKRETMFYLLQCPYLTFPLLSTVYETRMRVLFPHFSQNFFIGSLH